MNQQIEAENKSKANQLLNDRNFTDENGSKKNNWANFEKNEIFLLLSYFFFGIAFANYEPYAPLWLNQIFYENSFLIIGFVVVIPSIVAAIGTPFWGLLADRFGSKKFVILGLVAFGLMFLSLLFINSSTVFLIVLLIGYLFGSAHSANLFVFASKSINKPKEVIFAKQTITVSLAFVIFSPLVGWIYDTFANSMIIQLITAIFACIISIVLIFFVSSSKESHEEKNSNEINKKVALTSVPFIFIGLMLLTFSFQSGAGFWAYSSIYFLEELNVKGIYFSIFLIVKTGLAVPLSFLLGRVKTTKKMGIIVSIFVGYFLFVYTLMSIFPTNWILLIIFYSIPMYPLYNVFLYALVSIYSNFEKRATAFGIFSSIGTAGYVAGILILGAFADHFNEGILVMFPVSLILTIITLIISLVMLLFVFRKGSVKKSIISK